jgi:NAD(P)H-dependent FMN reductase
MITLICGTNRIGSNSKKVALQYHRMLMERGVEVKFLSLDEHLVHEKGESFSYVQEHFLIPAEKFLIIMPEYNGSFPGILKLMIDQSDIKKCWHFKKAMLTGVASGRAGNLRGMEHFSGIALYLKMNVHHNRLPISSVDKLFNEEGELTDQGTIDAINAQLDDFLNF